MDRLSTCSSLDLILSYLKRPARFNCLTVNRILYSAIMRDRLLFMETHMHITNYTQASPFVIEVWLGSTPYRRPNGSAINIGETCIYTSVLQGHSWIVEHLWKHGGTVTDYNPDKLFIPMQSYTEGMRFVMQFIPAMAKLSYISIRSEGGFGGLAQRLFECFRDFYSTPCNSMSVDLGSSDVHTIYLNIAKHFGARLHITTESYNCVERNLIDFPLDCVPVHIRLSRGDWHCDHLAKFLQGWKRGERDIRQLSIEGPHGMQYPGRTGNHQWNLLVVMLEAQNLKVERFRGDEHVLLTRTSDGNSLSVSYIADCARIDIEQSSTVV